jgi:purine-binding chemotaxis protein CheW
MPTETSVHSGSSGSAARAALVAEVHALEGRLRRAQQELSALGGDVMPGAHLLLAIDGRRGLLAAHRVAEVVQLVAMAPLPGAPSQVAGTFLHRGTPVVVADLATLLGSSRQPALDAQIVVLSSEPRVGLLVDRVERLVDSPRLFGGDPGQAAAAWRGATFVAGLCVEDGEVLPLLDTGPILAGLPRAGAVTGRPAVRESA